MCSHVIKLAAIDPKCTMRAARFRCNCTAAFVSGGSGNFGFQARYDFYVKIDTDSWVRPSTFRKIFELYDPDVPSAEQMFMHDVIDRASSSSGRHADLLGGYNIGYI